MTELIHALELGERRRKRARAAALVATPLILAGLAATINSYRAPLVSCRRHALALSRTYHSTLRHRIGAAFAGSDLPFREASWRSLDSALQRYARAWTELYRGACEAAYERRTETVEALNLQFDCLEQRQVAFSRFGEVLAGADRAALTNAGTAVAQLDPVDACANVALLSAPVPPPADPAARTRVASARHALGDARGFEVAGQLDRSQASIAEAFRLVEGPPLGSFAPIEAEAHYRFGVLERARGRWAEAEKQFLSAIESAELGRADDVRAQAAIELVEVVGHRLGRFDEGERWARAADVVLARIGRPARELATLAMHRGLLRFSKGRYDEAESDMRTALGLRQKLLPSNDPLIPITVVNLGSVLYQKGRWSEAAGLYRDARERFATALGEQHPRTLAADSNLANIQLSTGQFHAARDAFERVLALQTSLLGNAHPSLVGTLVNLASTLDELGDYAGAIERGERALEIARAQGPEDPLIPQLEMNLAIYLMSIDDFARAHQLLDSCLGRWRKQMGPAAGPLGTGEYELARLYYFEQDDAEAKRIAGRALERVEKGFGKQYPLIADILDLLGEIECSHQRPEAARQHHQRALEIRQSAGGEGGLVRTKLHLGVAELAMGDVGLARTDLETALALCNHREDDPRRKALVSWALARALAPVEEERARPLRNSSNAVLRSAGRRFHRELEGMSSCLRARSSAGR
jgi:tetratricopeptide (TPR) repeat protein